MKTSNLLNEDNQSFYFRNKPVTRRLTEAKEQCLNCPGGCEVEPRSFWLYPEQLYPCYPMESITTASHSPYILCGPS